MAAVDQIAVRIVFNRETARISPVVEDLASQYVSSYAPYEPVILFQQPVVAKELGIEVVNFVTGVVHPGLWKERGGSDEEEAVVIDIYLA